MPEESKKGEKTMNEILKNPKAKASFSAMDEENFFSFLTEMAETDVWKVCSADDIRMRTKDGILLIELGSEGSYEMHPDAVTSVRRRCGDLSGKILDRLNAEETAASMNIYWPHVDGEVKALIRGGKLLALHSRRYIPFQQKQLYETFKKMIEGKYDKVCFEKATYKHDRTYAIFEIVSERLLSGYKLAMAKAGITASKDVRAYVELATSDAGVNAISLHPSLSLNHNERVFITKPEPIDHRDNVTFAKAEAEMGKVFALVSDGIKNLKRLLAIELTYPSAVAIKIAQDRKLNLPGSLIKEIRTEFQIPELMGLTMNAHQFYFTLCEILEKEGFQKLTPLRQLRVKESLAQIALWPEAKWTEKDVNDVSW